LFPEEVAANVVARYQFGEVALPGDDEEGAMTDIQQFESVWDALEDDPEVAASMKARSGLVIEIGQDIKSWNITQAAAAKRLGLTQPRLNDLLRGRISKFSIDALITIARKAGLTVDLKVSRSAA
jgi:predicted XRE-type DNA-binding protein